MKTFINKPFSIILIFLINVLGSVTFAKNVSTKVVAKGATEIVKGTGIVHSTVAVDQNSLDLNSVGRVHLSIDPLRYNLNTDFTATLKVAITFLGKDGTSMFYNGPVERELMVSFDYDKSSTGVASKTQIEDVFVSNTIKVYGLKVDVLSITTSLSNNLVPEFLTLSSVVEVERYFQFTAAPTNIVNKTLQTSSTTNMELQLGWTPDPNVDYYELEYSYVDDASNHISKSNFKYDFKNNSTRVSTKLDYYVIPLLYTTGTIVYRVRKVGIDKDGISIPGPWSITLDNGEVSSLDANYQYTITSGVNINQMNWQHSTTFAEEGKRKDIVSYYDGLLKNRQQLSTLKYSNSVPSTSAIYLPIVGETIYDRTGRPVINVLPVPIETDKSLLYKANLNKNSSSVQFTYDDFDLHTSGCESVATPLNTTTGASNYYSVSNSITSSVLDPIMKNIIPDAGGFPYTQIEYEQDNTGRISRQSGVGASHKLGSGHETKYFYTNTSQEEIDAMFGNDGGYAEFYQKKIVQDANGQISFTYVDMAGKVIATCLAGKEPQNSTGKSKLAPLSTNNKKGINFNEELISKKAPYSVSSTNPNKLGEDGKSLKYTKKLYVSEPGQSFTIGHSINLQNLNDLTCTDGSTKVDVCLECAYDLKISIKDKCGVPVSLSVIKNGTSTSQTEINLTNIGITAKTDGTYGIKANGDCAKPDSINQDFTVSFANPGIYTIEKELSINEQSFQKYISDYFYDDPTDDTKDGPYYKNCGKDLTEVTLTDDNPNSCANQNPCNSCSADMKSYSLYTTALKNLNIEEVPSKNEYYKKVRECKELCDGASFLASNYSMMLNDVSPGGQYGATSPDDASWNLSVFNPKNQLVSNVLDHRGAYQKPSFNFRELVSGEIELIHDPKSATNAFYAPTTQLNDIEHESEYHYYDELRRVVYLTIDVKPAIAGTTTFNSLSDFNFIPEINNSIADGATLKVYPNFIRICKVQEETDGSLTLLNSYTPEDFLKNYSDNLPNGQYWAVEPQYLNDLSVFLNFWNDSWAASLVTAHPEYCYYEKYHSISSELAYWNKSTSSEYNYSSKDYDDALQAYPFEAYYNSSQSSPVNIEIGDKLKDKNFIGKYFPSSNPDNKVILTTLIERDPFYQNLDQYTQLAFKSKIANDLIEEDYNYKNLSFAVKNYFKELCPDNFKKTNLVSYVLSLENANAYHAKAACSSTTTNFIESGYKPATKDNTYNLVQNRWTKLVANYLVKKSEFIQNLAELSCASCNAFNGGTNGCIGDKTYVPAYTIVSAVKKKKFCGITYKKTNDAILDPINNPNQPCSWGTYQAYVSKDRRFGTPAQFNSNGGAETELCNNGDDSKTIEYIRTKAAAETYLQKGVFPTQTDFELMLNAFATNKYLSSTTVTHNLVASGQIPILGASLYDLIMYGKVQLDPKFTDNSACSKVCALKVNSLAANTLSATITGGKKIDDTDRTINLTLTNDATNEISYSIIDDNTLTSHTFNISPTFKNDNFDITSTTQGTPITKTFKLELERIHDISYLYNSSTNYYFSAVGDFGLYEFDATNLLNPYTKVYTLNFRIGGYTDLEIDGRQIINEPTSIPDYSKIKIQSPEAKDLTTLLTAMASRGAFVCDNEINLEQEYTGLFTNALLKYLPSNTAVCNLIATVDKTGFTVSKQIKGSVPSTDNPCDKNEYNVYTSNSNSNSKVTVNIGTKASGATTLTPLLKVELGLTDGKLLHNYKVISCLNNTGLFTAQYMTTDNNENIDIQNIPGNKLSVKNGNDADVYFVFEKTIPTRTGACSAPGNDNKLIFENFLPELVSQQTKVGLELKKDALIPLYNYDNAGPLANAFGYIADAQSPTPQAQLRKKANYLSVSESTNHTLKASFAYVEPTVGSCNTADITKIHNLLNFSLTIIDDATSSYKISDIKSISNLRVDQLNPTNSNSFTNFTATGTVIGGTVSLVGGIGLVMSECVNLCNKGIGNVLEDEQFSTSTLANNWQTSLTEKSGNTLTSGVYVIDYKTTFNTKTINQHSSTNSNMFVATMNTARATNTKILYKNFTVENNKEYNLSLFANMPTYLFETKVQSSDKVFTITNAKCEDCKIAVANPHIPIEYNGPEKVTDQVLTLCNCGVQKNPGENYNCFLKYNSDYPSNKVNIADYQNNTLSFEWHDNGLSDLYDLDVSFTYEKKNPFGSGCEDERGASVQNPPKYTNGSSYYNMQWYGLNKYMFGYRTNPDESAGKCGIDTYPGTISLPAPVITPINGGKKYTYNIINANYDVLQYPQFHFKLVEKANPSKVIDNVFPIIINNPGTSATIDLTWPEHPNPNIMKYQPYNLYTDGCENIAIEGEPDRYLFPLIKKTDNTTKGTVDFEENIKTDYSLTYNFNIVISEVIKNSSNVVVQTTPIAIKDVQDWTKINQIFKTNWATTDPTKQYEVAIELVNITGGPTRGENVPICFDDISLNAPCNTFTGTPIVSYSDGVSPCDAGKNTLENIGAVITHQKRELALQRAKATLEKKYITKCLSTGEKLRLNYTGSQYHYTLYYYDQSGNLVKTVPPEGVELVTDSKILANIAADRIAGTRKAANQPNHTMATIYRYNSLNQLTSELLPDHTATNKWKLIDNFKNEPQNIKGISYVDGAASVGIANITSDVSTIYDIQSDGNWEARAQFGSESINDAFYLDATNVVAVGDKGTLIKSSNSGKDWKEYPTGLSDNLIGVYFTSDGTGIVVATNGNVYTYTDTDITDDLLYENWTKLTSGGTSINGYTFKNCKFSKLDGTKIQFLLSATNSQTGNDALWNLTQNGTTFDWSEVKYNAPTYLLPNMQKGKVQNIISSQQISSLNADNVSYSNTAIPSTVGTIAYFDSRIIINSTGKLFEFYNNSWQSFTGLGAGTFLIPTSVNTVEDYSYFYDTDGYEYKWTATGLVKTNTVKREALKSISYGKDNQNYFLTSDNKIANNFNSTKIDLSAYTVNKIFINNNTSGNKGLVETTQGLYIIDKDNKLKSIASNTIAISSIKQYVYNSYSFYNATTYGNLGVFVLTTTNELYYIDIANAKASVVSSWLGSLALTTPTINSLSIKYNASTKNNNLVLCVTGTVNSAIVSDVYTSNEIDGNSTPLITKWTSASITNPIKNITNFSAPDNGNMLLAAADGNIVSYNATNKTYTTHQLPGLKGKKVNDITLDATKNIYIATEAGIYKKTAGTTNWQAYGATLNLNILSIQNTSSNIVFQGTDKFYQITNFSSGIHSAVSGPITNNGNPTKLILSTTEATAVGIGNSNGQVIYYFDGSQWAPKAQGEYLRLNDMASDNANQYSLAVGKQGTIVKITSNNVQRINNTYGTTTLTENLIKVAFSSDNKAYILSSVGNIYEYNNSTQTLIRKYQNTDATITSVQDLALYASSIAYLANNSKIVYCNDLTAASPVFKSYSTSEISALTLAYKNASTIFIAGGRILIKISDLTGTPTSVDKSDKISTESDYRDIYFVDENTAYLVGSVGKFYKSIDGGENWINKSVTTNKNTYTKINVLSPNEIYILGNSTSTERAVKLDDQADLISKQYWYDQAGRIILSQNSKQYNKNPMAYSYTRYDALGRTIESGEIATNQNLTQNDLITVSSDNINNPPFDQWLFSGTCSEITRSYYSNTLYNTTLGLENTRNRVAMVAHYKTENNVDAYTRSQLYTNYQPQYTHAYFYSYDIHGNVKKLISSDAIMTSLRGFDDYKTVDYEYDLVSGKVNMVYYQKNQPDQFIHKYEYDAENRIVNVYTSSNGYTWENDAYYQYYLHGPLARTELGEHKVQGIDYAYTVQGWIKGVNSSSLQASNDIGKDGITGSNIPKDQLGYTLGYFTGDYTPISTATTFESDKTAQASNIIDLYNGNISSMVSSVKAFSETAKMGVAQPATMLCTYSYDQLNRIKSVHKFEPSASYATTNSWSGATRTTKFTETFDYDANGNITKLTRNNNSGKTDADSLLDNLVYNYENLNSTKDKYNSNTNKLRSVDESAKVSADATDIETQATNNYTYDAIGNLVADASEGISNIAWNVQGKIDAITKATSNIYFAYDALGNRTMKKVVTNKGTASELITYTFYVRDAQGNVMSMYTLAKNPDNPLVNQFQQTEVPIYGSSRLGIKTADVVLPIHPAFGDYSNVPEYDPQNPNHVNVPIEAFKVTGDPTKNEFEQNLNYTLASGKIGYIQHAYLYAGSITLEPNSVLYIDGTVFGKTITVKTGATIVNVAGLGSIYTNYLYTQLGSNIINETDLTVTKEALLAGDIYNSGDLDLQNGISILLNNNKFINKGRAQISGKINLASSGYLSNTSSIVANQCVIFPGATLYNSGSLNCNKINLIGSISTLNTNDVSKIRIADGTTNGTINVGTNAQFLGQQMICTPRGSTDIVIADPNKTVNDLGINLNCNFNIYQNFELISYSNQLGKKSYELSNHLGNVLATVSDQKTPILTGTAGNYTITGFEAIVNSAFDYYAFGGSARKWFSGTYRYGFNGKENDPETGTQDYGFRMYNPSLGRFLSVDPLSKKFAWYTPYQFAGNKPIIAIDLDGAEEQVMIKYRDNEEIITYTRDNFNTTQEWEDYKQELYNEFVNKGSFFSFGSEDYYNNGDGPKPNGTLELTINDSQWNDATLAFYNTNYKPSIHEQVQNAFLSTLKGAEGWATGLDCQGGGFTGRGSIGAPLANIEYEIFAREIKGKGFEVETNLNVNVDISPQAALYTLVSPLEINGAVGIWAKFNNGKNEKSFSDGKKYSFEPASSLNMGNVLAEYNHSTGEAFLGIGASKNLIFPPILDGNKTMLIHKREEKYQILHYNSSEKSTEPTYSLESNVK